jgi:glycosyltransferase involved in cell wall biosynthesis
MFAKKYFERVNNFDKIIETKPEKNLQIIVVVPVFNEPDVDKTLLSLLSNEFCGFVSEIIFVVNSNETTKEIIKQKNLKSISILSEISKYKSNKKYQFK